MYPIDTSLIVIALPNVSITLGALSQTTSVDKSVLELNYGDLFARICK